MREGKRDESEKNKLKRTRERERNLPAYNMLSTAVAP